MATYAHTDELEGATFLRASLKGATLRFCDVSDVVMRGVELGGLDIDSHDLAFGTLVVNGVDVAPFVEAEWSLAQSLRHMVLVTDAWLRRAIQRAEQPFHEIGLIFTGAAQMGYDVSVFRTDDPPFDEILAVRAERQQLVTDFLATATPELLAEPRDNPWSADSDWHPSVGDCVRVILEEEWAHLRYVRRDLELLR